MGAGRKSGRAREKNRRGRGARGLVRGWPAATPIDPGSHLQDVLGEDGKQADGAAGKDPGARAVPCQRLLAVLLVCSGYIAAEPRAGEAASNYSGSAATAEEPSRLAGRSAAASDSVLFQGQVLFARNCSVGYCHGKGGRAGRGPRLRGRQLPADYLTRVIRDGIPNSTMGSWGDRLSEGEIASIVSFIQVLADLNLGDPDPVFGGGRFSAANVPRVRKTIEPAPVPSGNSDLVGDPGRGRSLFFDSGDDHGCAHCHAIDGRGAAAGPDLGPLASAPARMLLREILTPNLFVIPDGRVIELVTTAGDTLEVLRLGETATRLKLFDVTRHPPVRRNIRKDRIRSEEPTSRSAMPDTYASRYTVQQLLDLISFIKAGSGSPPVAVEDLF